jgi:hypothetical protein
MILILVSIIAAALIAVALLHVSENGYGVLHAIALFLGVCLLVASGLASVAYAFTAWSWFAAESKARIINREYGTHYTQEEVFYASSVIDTIRELDRKRVEVNGDILREKAK